MLKPSLNKSLNMWNSLRVSVYTTPEYRPQEFAGEEFYFATIEEFEIAIDTGCHRQFAAAVQLIGVVCRGQVKCDGISSKRRP